MPEPTTVVTGYVINIGVFSIIGTFMGMPLEALLLGGMAGMIVQGLAPSANRRSGFFAILLSMLLAGALSPLLITALRNYDALSEFGEELLKPVVPVVIGGAWPWLMPVIRDGLMERIKKWLESKHG